MSPERFRRMEALYDAASALSAGERTRFIEEQCADDEELRRELLAALGGAGSGLTGVVEQAAAAAVEAGDNWSGRRVGPYRIVRPLGQGGMGAVYLAVRDDDEFHKEVAIKTLKFELEGSSAVARFRAERQILAHLEHPNIARLLDGGTTAQGTPYIVLEYVEGAPIADWCQERKLSIEQRLRLFRQVCDAVEYAHQHLVVHRDLKPGNILVTGEGAPKLLDFGIARLLQDAGGDGGAGSVSATLTGAMLMTPDYASPEQVRGEPVSTATDVYSLGAVLYELLTGQRPYALTGCDPLEIARVVCTVEIRPPSALGNRRLRGDLDLIVARAMQKDPARRYRSVVELSEDIRRHLEGMPIAARPDSAVYRTVKFVRRHRVGVAAVAAVIAALAAGLAVSVYEAKLAQRRFAQVRELANTFLFRFYDQVTPLPGSTVVRKSVVETATRYLNGLAREAGNDRDLMVELAQSYVRLAEVQGRTGSANLGQVEEARHNLRHALDLYARVPVTRDSPAELRRKAAYAWWASGRLEFNAQHEDAAEPLTRRMLELLPEGAADPATRRLRASGEAILGEIRLLQGHTAEALALLESVLRTLVELRAAGQADAQLTGDINNAQRRLARAKIDAGDLDGALELYQDLLNGSHCDGQAPTSAACRDRAVWLTWLGDLYGAAGRPVLHDFAKAAAAYEEALAIGEGVAAADANDREARFNVAARCGKLGDAIWRSDPGRALQLYERAMATARMLVSKEHLDEFRGSYITAITRPLIRLGRLQEARKALVEATEVAKTDAQSQYAERLGEVETRLIWPDLLLAEGKREEARRALEGVVRDAEALRATRPQDLTPVVLISDACRKMAEMSGGEERRQALLRSAAAWHSWRPTSFTRREEERDLAAARQ